MNDCSCSCLNLKLPNQTSLTQTKQATTETNPRSRVGAPTHRTAQPNEHTGPVKVFLTTEEHDPSERSRRAPSDTQSIYNNTKGNGTTAIVLEQSQRQADRRACGAAGDRAESCR